MIYSRILEDSWNSDRILGILKYHFGILDSILEFWFGILTDDQNSVSMKFINLNITKFWKTLNYIISRTKSLLSSLSILGLGIWGENKEFFS